MRHRIRSLRPILQQAVVVPTKVGHVVGYRSCIKRLVTFDQRAFSTNRGKNEELDNMAKMGSFPEEDG